MLPEEFRTAAKAIPFLPFTIHLADGRELDVEHHDFIFCQEDGRTAIVCQGENFVVVDIQSVLHLEYKIAAKD